MRRFVKRSFVRDNSGTSAVEFAIMAPVFFGLMFWFMDIAFSLYVRNTFTHAVNTAARDVYLDPDRTDADLQAALSSQLSRFGGDVTVNSTLESVGSIEYHTISAQMVYHFKSPPFSGRSVTLKAEGRAPVIRYQLEETVEG